jgi:hypothetical protein
MCACQGTDEHGDVKRDVTANPKYSNTARPTGRTVNYPEWNPGVKHGERLIIRKGFRFTCLLLAPTRTPLLQRRTATNDDTHGGTAASTAMHRCES